MTSVADRQPVVSTRGLVASSHQDVSATGAAVLADGGTAMDAALAMAGMSFVCLPGQCGLGGDTFAVWYDARAGSYHSVQGSGLGPDGGDVAFYRGRELTALPLDGPLSVAVPGAMRAMQTLHAAAASRPLAELWAPAVAAARTGVPVTDKTQADIRMHAGKLARHPAAAAVFLPAGEPPTVGAQLAQPDLADSLERLARDPDDLYAGELATACRQALVAAGAPFSGREWAATTAPVTDTLPGRYRGLTVHQCRPPSPGYMVLQQAAVLDGLLGQVPWLSAPAVDRFARTAQAAFADRFERVGSDTDAWVGLLADDHVSGMRAALADSARSALTGPIADGDTTSFVAVDAHGNAVSYIHSLAFTFGSGFLVPGTGIMLNDRLGRGAYLDERHPNGVRPGRKPMHTLNTWIAASADGRPAYVGNTPGGDGQVQWNMQLLSHLLDHGLDPQAAVDAPRFTVSPGSDADSVGARPELRVESRLAPDTVARLRARGHRVVVQGPWDGGGSAQVIAVNAADRTLTGGSDSRFDGAAVGG